MVMIAIFASCNSSKPTVRTTKPYKKPTNGVVRVNKPVRHSRTHDGKTSNPAVIERQYEAAKDPSKSTSKEAVYSKSEILEATTRVKVTTAIVHDYINQYKEIAKNNMKQYGIPASITLGQGILESGAGTGPLSAIANNHFGIKCHKEWNGPSVSYDDDAAGECFRKYGHSSESYRDHSLFLTSRPRYSRLFELDKDDYAAWAKGLRAAGYATDPRYPEKLIGIIERYQLNKYDAEVMGREYQPVSTKEQININSDLYQVAQGDTLYSISRRFNIPVDELRRKNNITDNVISIGQNLKIN